MKCDNGEKSKCKWVGTVGTLHNHLAECEFTPIPCPNNCKDDDDNDAVKSIMRKELEEHLTCCPNRDFECTYCGEKGTFATISQVHDEVCEKKIISCINAECDKTMERQHVLEHAQSECEYSVIGCRHKSIGCDVNLQRKDMPAHEKDDTYHLHMAIDTVTKVKEECSKLKDQNSSLMEQTDSLKSQYDVLNNQSSTLRYQCGTLMRQFNNVHTQYTAMDMQSRRLQRQVDSVQDKCRTLEVQNGPLKKTCSMLEGECSALRYMINQSMHFQVTEFQTKKERNTKFVSPSFYAGLNGYHFKVSVAANGSLSAEGTHVSVFAHVIEGKYDAELAWPFVGTITLTLLNQQEDVRHYSKVMNVLREFKLRAGSNRGLDRYISHARLQNMNMPYLKDDTLFFKVTVEVAGQKPWLK